MKLFNTRTRTKEEFIPLHEGKVGIYVCGPTVYNYIHVGNALPLVVFDVLNRYLRYSGYEVTMIRNVTDIEDKIIRKANEEGVTAEDIADRYTKEFLQDSAQLGILPPTYMPKATEHVGDILSLVNKLIENGYAYALDNGDVYFDTQAFEHYGELSGQDMDELDSGARVDVDENKRHPMDFALWKSAKPGEPSWDSPWGKGRPGWHIECSAMSMRYLGETLDIHGGGQDLIFPHHENEKAQSEGATGKQFVRYWMHNGYINVDNRKMSKSLGNFFTVRDILAQFPGEVLRFFLISSQYRSPVNFSVDQLQQAQSALERLYSLKNNLRSIVTSSDTTAASGGGVSEACADLERRFREAMDDDLNTANALGAIFEFVKIMNIYFAQGRPAAEARQALDKLMEIAGVLGLLGSEEEETPQDVLDLLEQRKQARASKQWSLSDSLRDQLKALGYAVEDSREGQKVKRI